MGFHRRIVAVAKIDLDELYACGIRGVILDLDNTVVSEDDCYLSPGAELWIQQAKLQGLKFFILSNGKRRARLQSWSYRLDIAALGRARKPSPLAFRKAFAQLQLKPRQTVVIGDSLHTDVVGAMLSGCSSIQVASLPHPARWWEKLLGRWIHYPYPSELELWPLDSSG
ncbi:YqeG family HAD IIIA-type phosphatase [Leptolyngbya sp. FACHB-261]|uniref:YqeG family HAD IIIA-type phosphatase n=1 Tax=Leptolyngbya sp. FACHB-261 TaxID=2692806 RepID=UPI0028C3E5C3|nr:YqeG family HAD IIIA-type phosphatase [Leptolyngbya sp. FACHB-261]